MPHRILKRSSKYCFSNMMNLIIILVLISLTDVLNNLSYIYLKTPYIFILSAFTVILTLITTGYGLVVTRDVIDGGKELPKVHIGDSIVFGFKSSITTIIFTSIQIIVLDYIANFFHFPKFELKGMFLDIPKTINLFINHDITQSAVFFILSAIVVYITVFFMEISLARLADEGSLRKSLDIFYIKDCIDVIGWRKYAKEYTNIIIAIVILTYLKYGIESLHIIDGIVNLIIGFLIFTIQYLGIAWIYRVYKKKSATHQK
ncbi:MAG: DUF4013 domain-containing protein [Methanobrevibacter sp.]|nr:DUF4013 domain-containing protein [Methanobrevibacter sp.]